MLDAPERAGNRFSILLFLDFLLIPVTGFGVAVLFDVISVNQLQLLLLNGTLPLFSVLLVFAALLQTQRMITPIISWLIEFPKGGYAPNHLHRRLHHFGRDFWALVALHVLVSPLLTFWLLDGGISAQNSQKYIHFMLLQAATATLIGIPGYLFGLHQLGKLVGHLSLDRIHASLTSKTLLLAGIVPIVSYSLLADYHWVKTGEIDNGYLITALTLALITLIISLLSIRSMQQALQPFHELFSRTGASTYKNLAKLRPASVDEIGHLTQTLGKLFQRLGDQETHMRAIVDTAAEGIIVVDEKGIINTFNPAAEHLFGYRSQELRGHHLALLTPGLFEARQTISAHIDEREVEGVLHNGSRIQMAMRVSAMNISGKPMFTCMVADISQRKIVESELLAAEARYRALVETAHDLVWIVDSKGHWTYLNSSARTIYGYEPEQMIGKSIFEFSAPENSDKDTEAFQTLLNGKDLYQYETIQLDRNGNPHDISFNARAQLDEHGKVIKISGTARDITDKKAFRDQLSYQAEHDSLTNLFNRHYFQQELKRTVARMARNTENTCALFYIDLDQFKYINDTLGHAAGDRLLIELSEQLMKHVREGDLLARFGGDEFTLLLYNIHEADVLSTANHFRVLFEEFTFIEDGRNFNISCSIGAALINRQVNNAEDALSHADIACNIAKAQGRNCVNLYDPSGSNQEGMAEDMGWAARIREMLDHDRFQLVYQPIMSLDSNDIQHYEVLVRMVCDDGEIILPGGFMPAAERFGLIQLVDRWVVRHALLRLEQCNLQGKGRKIRFSINLSGKALEDDSLLPLIREWLDESILDPSLVCFEITETAIIAKLAEARIFIDELKNTGCQFALDNFGTGFSSFAYLKNLPVDMLKIDGTFVQGLAGNQIDQAMVKSMNDVAHALGKQTIAEHVEDAKTLELLRSFGVDFVQGNHIGKPCGSVIHTTGRSANNVHSITATE